MLGETEPLGDLLGLAEGLTLGETLELGLKLGDTDGDTDGLLEGEIEGDMDELGDKLGDCDGETLGETDGLWDGLVDGETLDDGDKLRLWLGETEGLTESLGITKISCENSSHASLGLSPKLSSLVVESSGKSAPAASPIINFPLLAVFVPVSFSLYPITTSMRSFADAVTELKVKVVFSDEF